MNEILKKKIEEAAAKYSGNQIGLDYIGEAACEQGFIDGAKYALSHQWISVKESLPEYNEVVIVAYGDDEYAFCHRSNSKYVHTDNNNFCNYGDKGVLAWMPIPKFETKK